MDLSHPFPLVVLQQKAHVTEWALIPHLPLTDVTGTTMISKNSSSTTMMPFGTCAGAFGCPHEENTIVTSILHMEKLRTRKVSSAQSHTAGKGDQD